LFLIKYPFNHSIRLGSGVAVADAFASIAAAFSFFILTGGIRFFWLTVRHRGVKIILLKLGFKKKIKGFSKYRGCPLFSKHRCLVEFER
jgi:hypothetical protein